MTSNPGLEVSTTPKFTRINLKGQQFGRLFVVDRSPTKNNYGKWLWICLCKCGNTTLLPSARLTAGITSSCGCLHKEGAVSQCQLLAIQNTLSTEQSQINDVYRTCLGSAKARGLAFELSKEETFALSQQPCSYCTQPPSNRILNKYCQRPPLFYSGLDRVDNTLGYLKGNVVPCCKMCNVAKNSHTYEEFVEWIRRVYETYHS